MQFFYIQIYASPENFTQTLVMLETFWRSGAPLYPICTQWCQYNSLQPLALRGANVGPADRPRTQGCQYTLYTTWMGLRGAWHVCNTLSEYRVCYYIIQQYCTRKYIYTNHIAFISCRKTLLPTFNIQHSHFFSSKNSLLMLCKFILMHKNPP